MRTWRRIHHTHTQAENWRQAPPAEVNAANMWVHLASQHMEQRQPVVLPAQQTDAKNMFDVYSDYAEIYFFSL